MIVEHKEISRATLGRLPIYLDYLKTLPGAVTHISATAIAKALHLGEVQVRKDLAIVSDGGRPKVGYQRVLRMSIRICSGRCRCRGL